MGETIAFRRKDANEHKWICGEERFQRRLSDAAKELGLSDSEVLMYKVKKILKEGLFCDYNLEIKAKCGECDHDVEIELIQTEEGQFYYAVYTDERQAKRSNRASYYNTGFMISMNYLIGQIKDEAMMAGVCINPYSDSPCIIPRSHLKEVYMQCIG